MTDMEQSAVQAEAKSLPEAASTGANVPCLGLVDAIIIKEESEGGVWDNNGTLQQQTPIQQVQIQTQAQVQPQVFYQAVTTGYQQQQPVKQATAQVMADVQWVNTARNNIGGTTTVTIDPLVYETAYLQAQANNTVKAADENSLDDDHEAVIIPKSKNNLQNVIVMSTNNYEDGRRKFDKKYFCLYCEKSVSKIPRHLVKLHYTEAAVIDFVHEKDPILKDAKLAKLRNLGNHRHNMHVLQKGKGSLIVKKRPTLGADPREYIPCSYCYAYYVKRDLWKHECPLNGLREKTKQKGSGSSDEGVLSVAHRECTLEELRGDVLGINKMDDVSHCISYDPLILEIAQKECLKLNHDREEAVSIKLRLRELGRLLLELRFVSGDPLATLHTFIDPAKFQNVVIAARRLAGFNHRRYNNSSPSLNTNVGYSLKKCTYILQAKASTLGDTLAYKRASEFHDMLEFQFHEETTLPHFGSILDEGRGNPKWLSLAQDVACLTSYLKRIAHEQMRMLHTNEDIYDAWLNLSEIALTQVILFNRRRLGSIAKMKLSDYARKHQPLHPDVHVVYDAMSLFEKELCKKLTRIEVIGKKGKVVPVLLTDEIKLWIDILVAKRHDVGIPDTNEYLFPMIQPDSRVSNTVRGLECLQRFAFECGASSPENLQCKQLKNHIATLSQILNLKDNELCIVARLTGHDVRIHGPDAMLQVIKLCKVLISIENGDRTRLVAQSLDDIPLFRDEEITVEYNFMEDGILETQVGISPVQSSSSSSRRRSSSSQKKSHKKKHKSSSASSNSTKQSKSSKKSRAKSSSSDSPRKKPQKRPWTPEEKAAVFEMFQHEILQNKLPGKGPIQQLLARQPVLGHRTWSNVKDFIRNYLVTKSRQGLL
ncbi:uncharacterized protein LOC121417348 [Lytechinus variegatus]|uniref:uncharacterized protein LOC121417348 n=1 Tax=Lytechinus variegatus TaxID=7654 RepID=UPI001BB17D6B|nr:uncharacterized protein LOC121417348 [Lytechinus variegatus]